MDSNQSPRKTPLPELLAPAGSMTALEAAVDAGADAVYFGGPLFNARIGAKNFGGEEMAEAIEKCRVFGVKSYITLNTLVLDRELDDVMDYAARLYEAGADALITADVGLAKLLRERFPELPLHASTQMTVHDPAAAELLYKRGFSRVVLAREMNGADIKSFCRHTRAETEMFIHGALCVSVSGQCLFSSIVGGRSGNRGECAQPCRLPYKVDGCERYPLSLKDLCLGAHIPEIIASGVTSLKIEGRMKSPEYVYAVTKVYRRLLDEGRAATYEEMKYLAGVFSRGGFTDGYYTGRTDSSMLGVRSDADKAASLTLEPYKGLKKRVPLKAEAYFETGKPSILTLCDGVRTVSAAGAIPQRAINRPLTRESAAQNLTKLGNTYYSLAESDIDIKIADDPILPLSALNMLRRDAVALLTGPRAVRSVPAAPAVQRNERVSFGYLPQGRFAAFFVSPAQITKAARSFFDKIYLPVSTFDPALADGIALPPVVFESERVEVRALAEKAAASGATDVLINNLGHLSLVEGLGLVPHASHRFNVFNSVSARELLGGGYRDVVLSPELSLPQSRDICASMGGNCYILVYGRLPLMVLQKCVGRELVRDGACEACQNSRLRLVDRTDTEFPVLPLFGHRNMVFNSLPTYMGDRKKLTDDYGLSKYFFVFTVETAKETDMIVNSYRNGEALPGRVRRIKQ